MRAIAALGAIVLAACSPSTPSAPPLVSTVPAAMGDGWAVSTVQAEGFDAARLDRLTSRIAGNEFGAIDSLLVARDRRLCFEAYFAGGIGAVHELQSVTKSVTSALVGVAIARGAMAGVQQPVVDVLPEFAAAARDDPAKNAIRVVHLLTMSVGLDWDESTPSSDARNTLTQMNASRDWVAFVVSRRVAEAPGQRFVYNSGGVILLGAIIQATTDQDVAAFAQSALFAPLGISDATWFRNPSRPDQIHTGGGLALRARDQAKFGELYLDDGVWNGQRVLPADWVRDSTRAWLPAGDRQYGFLWWLRSTPSAVDMAEAWGARGQHIFVVRQLNLVVVVNARDDRRDEGRAVVDEVIAAAR